MKRIALLSLAVGLTAWTAVEAQTLELRAHKTTPGSVTAGIGDTVQIDVIARLDHLDVSGIDLHLSLPKNAFDVVDQGRQSGVQPFAKGSLFSHVVEAYNGLNDVPDDADGGRLHLRYAALTSLGEERAASGGGVVASFDLVVLGMNHAQVWIEDTPILNTRLVLPDGTTERRFVSLSGIEVSTDRFPTAVEERSWADVKVLLIQQGRAD